jgi:hypothetical protein
MSATGIQTPYKLSIELEDVVLVVPDTSKPVWFGTYYEGKLGIYEAEVVLPFNASVGMVALKDNSVTYICTLTETGKADFMTFADYDKTVSVSDICTHIQANMWNVYLMKLAETTAVTLAPSTNTLQ